MADRQRVWIEEPADDATPELERVTRPWSRAGRPTPAVIGVMKVSPETLKTVNRMNGAVTFGGSVLGRVREELIASATSALNECFY